MKNGESTVDAQVLIPSLRRSGQESIKRWDDVLLPLVNYQLKEDKNHISNKFEEGKKSKNPWYTYDLTREKKIKSPIKASKKEKNRTGADRPNWSRQN